MIVQDDPDGKPPPARSGAESVAELRALGFAVCKPDPVEKKPTYKGWPTRSLEASDFEDGDQVGVLGGPLSDGGLPGHALVIVDLDATEANQLADEYLPATAMMEGRESKPRSHRYYLVETSTIPAWATSTATQAAAAAKEHAGHPGPFLKHFTHRETKKGVLDLIGTGGQVVAPRSLHPSGERREWEGGSPGQPAVIEFLELWRAVCELASACGCEIPNVMPRPPAARTQRPAKEIIDRASAYLAKIPGAVTGQSGHSQLFKAARMMAYGFDLSEAEAADLIMREYNPRCEPPWKDWEILHKLQDADLVPFGRPRGFLRDAEQPERNGQASLSGKPKAGGEESNALPGFTDTDIANGRAFVADHGENVRYVADWGQWVVFEGKRWVVDRSETLVERMAKDTADRLAQVAANKVGEIAKMVADTEDEEEQGRLKAQMKKAMAALAHAKKTADMRSIRRMLQAARSEPAICVADGAKVFDTHRHLLNCPNGTVDLRTGEIQPHQREDHLTRLCPTRFEPNASRNDYIRFLDTVFHGHPAIAKYVRELSGYVITGEVSDQTMSILNGDGSNGKNVLVDTWKAVLGEGEYAHSAAAELLVGDGFARHPTELTGLRGSRLVVCSETGEDGQLDETKMKALTGGDTVTARYMRGDFFQFEPTHKIVLLTNNRPRVKGTDHGVWRRLRLIPFAVRFWKEADREADLGCQYDERFRADPGLGERLRTSEAEGVLADMVDHAAAFYHADRMLSPPAEVTGATAEYRVDQDVIGQFFAAKVREDCEGEVKAADLYKAFAAWWEAEGHQVKRVPSPTKFGREAKRKFNLSRPHGTVYAVRLLSNLPNFSAKASPQVPQVEAFLGVSAHTHTRSRDLTPKVPLTCGTCGDDEAPAVPNFDYGPDFLMIITKNGPMTAEQVQSLFSVRGLDEVRVSLEGYRQRGILVCEEGIYRIATDRVERDGT